MDDARSLPPVTVTRGVNRHDGASFDGRSLRVDYLRVVAPLDRIAEVREVLALHGMTLWGPERRARYGFARAVGGAFGASLMWDDEYCQRAGGRRCCAELPGGELQRVADVRSLLVSLSGVPGLRVTRLDVACDVFEFRRDGDEASLVECVSEAVRGSCVVGSRTFREVEGWSRGRSSGRTVYIGARGKNGSGRFVRCYDKGAERGGASRVWERFEAEFTDSCAAQVVARLTGDVPWMSALLECVASSVDFRAAAEGEGERQHSERRPRLPWWSTLVHFSSELVRAARPERPGLVGVARWLGAGGPLALLDELRVSSGWTWERLVEHFTSPDAGPSRAFERVRGEWAEELRELSAAC